MPTAISPLLPVGAGRTLHKVWPAVGVARSLGQGGVTANISPRAGSTEYGSVTQGQFGIGGATTSVRTLHATPAVVLGDAAAAGQGAFAAFGDAFVPLMEALDAPATAADVNCLRFVAILSGSFLGNTVGDSGIQIIPGLPSATSFVTGVSSGIQFGPVGPATVALMARTAQGGPLTVNQNVSAAFMANINPNHWNQYEIRILGAGQGTAAVLKCLVNNIQVIPDISFAQAVGLLPGCVKVGAPNNGSVGFHCGIYQMWNANSPSMGIYCMSLTMAPNETSLL